MKFEELSTMKDPKVGALFIKSLKWATKVGWKLGSQKSEETNPQKPKQTKLNQSNQRATKTNWTQKESHSHGFYSMKRSGWEFQRLSLSLFGAQSSKTKTGSRVAQTSIYIYICLLLS